MLALIITLVPLVLGLFLVFVTVKLVFSCIAERATRGPATPHREVQPAADASPVKPSDDLKGE